MAWGAARGETILAERFVLNLRVNSSQILKLAERTVINGRKTVGSD
eukprot:COSAG05_NODE_6916_length_881_cov_4.644501_2_plen_46_part_00